MSLSGEVNATENIDQASSFDRTTKRAAALDIVVRWGDWVLGVHELSPPRPFFAGEDNADVILPRELLGTRRLPLVLVRWDGNMHLVVPKDARIVLGGQTRRFTAARLIARGLGRPSSTLEGAAEVPFLPGQTATISFDKVAIDFGFTEAAPLFEREPLFEKRVVWSQAASFALHALVLSILAFVIEPADVDIVYGMTADQLNELQRRIWRLDRNELRRRFEVEGFVPLAQRSQPLEAAATQAMMDSWAAAAERWAQQLDAEAARRENTEQIDQSMIGVLYDWPAPPPPPKQRPTIESVMNAPPIVLPEERKGSRFYGPFVRMGSVSVSGRLPAEVIQRIVRQKFGRFRLCYENGLRRNPNLMGRIAVRFVIGRDGATSNVGNGGSDVPDSAVLSCVLKQFHDLEFPQPERGIVTVVFPIMFTPGG